MEFQQIIDPFHRELFTILKQNLSDKVEYIASGKAKTFEEYKEKAGYIRAITEILDKCEEIEKQKYGRPGNQDKENRGL